MKTFTINNCTKKNVVIECRGKQQIVSANDKQIIEAEETDTLRIFKAEDKSAHLYMAKYFENDNLRKIRITLILLLNFDLYIEVKTAPKRITINEKYYHFYTIFMFSLLQLGSNNKVTYEYHRNSDKMKLFLFSSVTLFPMAAACLAMTVISLFALFDDFSAFSVAITLFAIGLDYLFISLAKTLNKFKNFNNSLSYILKESKIANVYSDNGRLIKYWEVSD